MRQQSTRRTLRKRSRGLNPLGVFSVCMGTRVRQAALLFSVVRKPPGSQPQKSCAQRKAELVIVWCAWMAARWAPMHDEQGLKFHVAVLASAPTQA